MTSSDSFRALPPTTVCGITFRLYESNKTGLRGLLMETGEPLCNIHCVVATESDTHEPWTHKDDGLPHTLEHAIFMGSELFPYKGILDKLANRCLADGTNAWTATDHTCYTMESAGHEGCLNLLPIYADHILYPTLTDSCFHTEVHHVTGEGEDKGVVYCEMQARENNSGSLVDRAVLELLYPTGGYSSETGGKMSNLQSLTNAAVTRYHRELYRPDNCCFIVSGTAGAAEFLAALQKVEERVLSKGYVKSSTPRPWGLPVAPMAGVGVHGIQAAKATEGTPKSVPFPSKDESAGVVSMAWRGPTYDEQPTWAHLHLLWQYLTDGAAAPLTKHMVEVAEPLCTRVGPADEIFTEGYHQVWFRDAKCERLDSIPAAFYAHLADALASFDLSRMHSVIQLRRRRVLEGLERAPTRSTIRRVIEHFLYATRGGVDGAGDAAEMAALASGVDVLPHLTAAEALTVEGWVALGTKYMLDRQAATVVGKPSAALADEIPAAVTKRQEAKKAELGEEGLKAMAQLLKKATSDNETPIPDQYLTAVPIPSKASVRSIPLVSLRGAAQLVIAPNSGEGVPAKAAAAIRDSLNASCASLPDGLRKSLSAYWQEWAHISSQFVSVAVTMDTSHLTSEQRLYLPLLEDVAFKLPCVLEDGTSLTKEAFVTALQGDTVRYSCDTGGIVGGSAQMLTVFVQVELDKGAGLALGLRWLRRALYLTSITADNLKSAVEQRLGRIPAAKRDGNGIARALLGSLIRDPHASNSLAAHAIRQYPFLTKLAAQLATDDGAASVVAAMNGLRAALLAPSRMNVFIAGDLTELPDPYSTLAAAIAPPTPAPPDVSDMVMDMVCTDASDASDATAVAAVAAVADGPLATVSEKLIASGRTGQAVLCALSAIETHYLVTSAPGIGAYSADHSALLVAIEYLTALEGDFWVKLRGPGLTYSYFITARTDAQVVQFGLFKCTDMLGAYTAAKDIIEGYASERTRFEELVLEGAKSTVTYSIVRGTSTRLSAAGTAFDNQYEGKGVDYSKWLLQQVDDVSGADALHALKKYIVPLFDADANLAATCPANKLDEDADGLIKQLGVPVRKLQEESLFTAFEAEGEGAAAQPTCEPAKKGGAAFSFAKNYKCECPKCEQPEEPKR